MKHLFVNLFFIIPVIFGQKIATTDLEKTNIINLSVGETIKNYNYSGYGIDHSFEGSNQTRSQVPISEVQLRGINRSSRRFTYLASSGFHETPPPSENELHIDRQTLIANGYYPQIVVGEDSTLYFVYATYDASVTTYLMFYVYYSSDEGNNWSYLGGAYNSSRDIYYPDIDVTDDRIIVSYVSGGQPRVYWKKLDGSAYDFVDVPMGVDYEASWGSIISDKFYYGETDTWLYITYIAHDTTTIVNGWYDNGIFYTHSEDNGVTWSDQVQLSSGLVGAFRPGIAIGYITPEPYTQVDHVITTWRDTLYNGYMAKIDIYDETFTTTMVLPSFSGDDGWGHYAPSVAGYYEDIIVTSQVWWGSSNVTNVNDDISMTFSSDGGNTFGEDYSWYYWIDNDDLDEKHPTPAFDTTGVLGFSWHKGTSIMYRTNTTLYWLQGWDLPGILDNDVSSTDMISPAINDATYYVMYDVGNDYGVYFDSFDLGSLSGGTLTGTVTNAVDGTVLSNVRVCIADELCDTTSITGSYTIENVPPGYTEAFFMANQTAGSAPLTVSFQDLSTTGTQNVTAELNGYIPYSNSNIDIVNNQTTILNISMSPDIGDAVYRFVLSWSDLPADLDIHLVTPEIGGQSYHLYWASTGSELSLPYAELDNDVTTGYGPETITIYQLESGTYTLYVHNYSENPSIITSEAVLQIYGNSGFVTNINVPTSGTGLYWDILTIDGTTGILTINNSINDVAPAMVVTENIIKQYPPNRELVSWYWDFGDSFFSSEQNPTHVYSEIGTYDVSLTVSDGANYSVYERSEYIVVVDNYPPEPTLFFSEYAEGSSNNKYLEIYNGTGAAVDLSAYSVSTCSNGCNTNNEWDYPNNITFAAGTIVADGDVYVVHHGSASSDIVAQGDQTFTYLSNGDDVMALTVAGATASTYTIIDIIGDMGDDPGSGWDVAAVTNGTKNHTLVRKYTITSGNTDWSTSAGTTTNNSEWIVLDQDTWDYVGSHPYPNPDYLSALLDSLLINEQFIADGWSINTTVSIDDVDDLFNDPSASNVRTVIGGMDMDQDGYDEMIMTDYNGHRVIVFEYGFNNAFDAVWTAPVITTHYFTNPRTVGVGDLDNDGRQEIVFPSANDDSEGYHIYEWDGVIGSDNYGTTYSSVCQVEIDRCCAGDGAGTASYGASFRGDHDRLTIFDVDGDGRDEFVQHIRRGSPRGTLVVSLTDGDDIVHNSGGSLETWTEEFWINRSDYGGGSPLHALPADLNGDGHYEVINHTWDDMHFYNFTSTDTNEYSSPVVGSADSYYQATPGSDQYSMFGGNAHDIDGDGNDEAYFVSYGSWGVGAGDVYVIDYDSTDDVLTIGEDHVRKIASGSAGTNVTAYYDLNSWAMGSIFDVDGDGLPNIFLGGSKISSMECFGDPRDSLSYITEDIYSYEFVSHITIKDSLGVTTTMVSHSDGYITKVESNFNGSPLDFDNDGRQEILVGFQGVPKFAYITYEHWNGSGWESTIEIDSVQNLYHSYVTLLENSSVVIEYIVITNDTLVVLEDSSSTIDLLDNDLILNITSFTLAIVDSVDNGTIALVGDTAFTYSPNANFFGYDTVSYRVFSSEAADTGLVFITVTAVNDAPVASAGTVTTDEDSEYSGTLSASDIDGDSLTYSVLASPSNGTATVTDSTSGTYTYSPTANYNGSDSFAFSASDGTLSDTATVSITITAVDDIPVASNDTVTVYEDTDYSGTLMASDGDGDALTFSIIDSTVNGTVTLSDPATGTFTYSPLANFNGSDSLLFSASDGILLDTGSVTIVVTTIDDLPVVANPLPDITVNEDASDTTLGDLKNVFLDVDEELIYSHVVNDTGLVFISVTNDTVTLQFLADANGSTEIVFTATNPTTRASVSDTALVTVLPMNDAPEIISSFPDTSMVEDETLSLLIQFYDMDGDSLTIYGGSDTGAVTVNWDGELITMTSAVDWNGSSGITVIVMDDSSAGDTANFTLTVEPANDPPEEFSVIYPTVSDTFSTHADNDTLIQFTWGKSNDVDSDVTYNLTIELEFFGNTYTDIHENISDTTISVSSNSLDPMLNVISEEEAGFTYYVHASDDEYNVASDVGEFVLSRAALGAVDGYAIPDEFALHQNYPNPFNPVTTLRYDLPENGLVTIIIYDMLGREVKTLINHTQDAGYRSIIWDATNDYGKPVSAGIYLYQIQAGEYISTKKMVLLK